MAERAIVERPAFSGNMLIVGLTGGIAAGKTAVSDGLAQRGAPIIDTDVIAREVIAVGTPGLAALVERFGSAVLQADGSLDRRAMRQHVFARERERRALEAIVHPRIRTQVQQRLLALAADLHYAVVVIPLLTEGNRYPFLQHIVVVDVAPEVQIERLRQRDAITRELAQSMLAAQATRAQRLALADYVLDNSGDRSQLKHAIAQLHAHLLARSARSPKA